MLNRFLKVKLVILILHIFYDFNKNFLIEEYSHIPNQAIAIRANWNSYDFTEKELYKFIDESILFVQELIRIIYEEHTKN